MKKKKVTKSITLAGAITLSMLMLAGCSSEQTAATQGNGSSGQTASTQGSEVSDESTEARKVIVGIGNAFEPFCYLDENENLAGYEYEVLKLVDEALPQYEFIYEPTEFKNLFVGLDTGAYDVAVQNMGWNEERAEKYLYGDVSNFNSGGGYIIEAAAGRIDIQGLDDLQGKIVGVSPTFNGSYLLDAYNEAHAEDEQIIIQYSDATTEQRWSDIVNGVIDASINTSYVHEKNVQAYGDAVEAYGVNVFADYNQEKAGRYLYSKDEEQLKADVDVVLQGLLDDGTLAQLSIEFFGVDYASEP